MSASMPFPVEVILLGLLMPLAFAYLLSLAGLVALSLPSMLKSLIFHLRSRR